MTAENPPAPQDGPGMLLLDLTLPTPAENLALDEALLEWLEPHPGGEALRFWESDAPFVVLGAGGRVEEEVLTARCAAAGVPVLRRCSGGGTVLQGPGCLNYALVLDRTLRPEMDSIEGTNRAVLGRVAAALARLGAPASMRGTSDLVARGRKFSGNAQRRRKTHILFHGTILHHFALDRMGDLLREPPRQPDYRAHRTHDRFVRNLRVDPARVRAGIAAEWDARTPAHDWPRDITARLVETRYSRDDWNLCF